MRELDILVWEKLEKSSASKKEEKEISAIAKHWISKIRNGTEEQIQTEKTIERIFQKAGVKREK